MLSMKPRTAPVPSKHRARLTEEAVIQIFTRRHDKVSPTVVSNLYGVNEKTVRDIWSGRTWSKETRHLDPSRAASSKKILEIVPPAEQRGAEPKRCEGITFKIDTAQAQGDSSMDEVSRANDQARDGAIPNYSRDCAISGLVSSCLRSQEHSQDSLTRNMASKVHEREQPAPSCVISIDEQLYEWERRGFWLF
jgi:hypothetical protein